MLALGADPARWWFQREWTDTGVPLRDEIRVSYSRLDKLENCELQYVLGEELGLGERGGYQAWVGKLVHGLIEDCEQGRIPREPDDLVAAVEERWQPERFPSAAISESFRRLVLDLALPNWFDAYGRTPAVATERYFEFAFDDATVNGYIDRIGPILSGGNHITDFKTGKGDRAPKPEESLQLGIYYLAVGEAEELAEFRPVRRLELAYLRGNWRTGEIDVHPWQMSSGNEEEYQEHMRERLSGLIERIRELNATEVYRANPGADCFFCQFKTMCSLFPEGRPLFAEEVST